MLGQQNANQNRRLAGDALDAVHFGHRRGVPPGFVPWQLQSILAPSVQPRIVKFARNARARDMIPGTANKIAGFSISVSADAFGEQDTRAIDRFMSLHLAGKQMAIALIAAQIEPAIGHGVSSRRSRPRACACNWESGSG